MLTPTTQQPPTDPTLLMGVHVGATSAGLIAAMIGAWAARDFNLSPDSATAVAGAVGALAASVIHYIHARLHEYANTG